VNSNRVDSIIRRTGATTNLVFLAEGGNVPMLQSLTLAVVAALALTMPSGRGDEQHPQEDGKEQSIKAEVRGTLRGRAIVSNVGLTMAWPARTPVRSFSTTAR
jgi:hypothetical protein